MEIKTAADIIDSLKARVEKGRIIGKDEWLDEAFSLNTLIIDEIAKLFDLRHKVAVKKKEFYHNQEGKKNVAAAEMETDALKEHWDAELQEEVVRQIKRFIRIAEKHSDLI